MADPINSDAPPPGNAWVARNFERHVVGDTVMSCQCVNPLPANLCLALCERAEMTDGQVLSSPTAAIICGTVDASARTVRHIASAPPLRREKGR